MVVTGCRTTILRPLRGPQKVPGDMYNIGRLPSGVRLMYKIARAAPSRRHRIQDARTSEDENSAPHGTRPAGRREDPVRAPTGRRAVHLFIGRSPEAYRTAAGRHLYGVYGLLTGALRLHSTNFHRTPPGCRTICDHTRRRNENRKGPVRSLKSTASRRVGKIVRGPVDM